MTKIDKNVQKKAFLYQKLRLFMNKEATAADEKAEKSDDLSGQKSWAYYLSDNGQKPFKIKGGQNYDIRQVYH